MKMYNDMIISLSVSVTQAEFSEVQNRACQEVVLIFNGSAKVDF